MTQEEVIEKINFFISAVEYDQENEKIKKARSHEKIKDYGVGYPFIEKRARLIDKLEKGVCYYTLVKQANDVFDFRVDKKVLLLMNEDDKYIRTDEKEQRDYLEGIIVKKMSRDDENIE
ncbi:MAG: hypothetical protein ACOC85_01455 [Thermoplasmatota archaeon]